MPAAPPDVLRVDEKYLREYCIFNCLGMLITTNHRRRVLSAGRRPPALSRLVGLEQEQFSADTGTNSRLVHAGGNEHVAAYLHESTYRASIRRRRR